MVITWGKGGGQEVKEGEGEKKEMTWDGEHTIKCTDDVLCNYAPEPYIVLLTNGTSINSIIF